jgi:hypothetical protein
MKVTIEQITENFATVEATVKSLSSEEQSELVTSLDYLSLNGFTAEQLSNLGLAIKSLNEESRILFCTNIVDNTSERSIDFKAFMKANFTDELNSLMEQSTSQNN